MCSKGPEHHHPSAPGNHTLTSNHNTHAQTDEQALRCHMCNATLPHPHTRNCTHSHTRLLMQLRSPSYPDARTRTTLKDTMQHRDIMAPLPTMTQLHKGTEKQPHEHPYKIPVTCSTEPKWDVHMGRQKPLPPKRRNLFLPTPTAHLPSHIHARARAHTKTRPKVSHHHRIHQHTLSLRQVTRRNTTGITHPAHSDSQPHLCMDALGSADIKGHTGPPHSHALVIASHAHTPVRALPSRKRASPVDNATDDGRGEARPAPGAKDGLGAAARRAPHTATRTPRDRVRHRLGADWRLDPGPP